MFSGINIIKALEIGFIGLAFLLAHMAFWLIKKVQEKDSARRSVLLSSYVFMTFSLAVLTGALFHNTSSKVLNLAGSTEWMKSLETIVMIPVAK